ncbi:MULTISPECIES: hypothetical protein [unclassified Paenibacillus]|uniref:hypothetical protein n=1 Tax=unclassified Paenibacillus TaxID=185978 RepID=UPI001AE4F39D|nr:MULTISPECIES: hypothetical protein [unclassified Paenibacillus]MBP1156213.1 hypothetical protein [Paenibacillus sp. PvP091]MBP1168401.1 hypothetical protein [Paenibacillus sp. PvR098]MBP2439429.1 hypothetical protein [Paenibacillus sp. PvP052]
MKPKRKRTKTSILYLATALIFGSAVPAFAADGGTPPAVSSAEISMGTAPVLGKVDIGGSHYFELKNVTMLPEQGSKTVTFTVTVHNGGSSDLLFIDYWVRLKTKSGNQISVRVLPQDKDKNRITPKSSQDISFYASVNGTTELNDLIFEFIKWDFSQTDFERKIGEVAVPANYSIVTAAGEAHTIQITGNPVKTTIKKVLLSKNEKNYTPTIVLNMENVGTRSVVVPGYQYLLRSSEGYMYPLDAKGIKDLSINPQVNEEIELSGSVPVSVKLEGWQLVIVQNAADVKLNLPIAYYALPDVSKSESVDTGKEYNFSNKEGTYTAQLNTVQRLPWEDQDILTAGFTLANKGPESLPIPAMTGYFMLDNAVKVEARLIKTDKVIGLAPNASAQFQFIGKIPYTYEFGEVKLVLQEKSSSSESQNGGPTQASALLEFVHRAELMNITYNNIGQTYNVKSVGRSSSFKVREVRTYTGETTNTFAAIIEVKNLEKRFSDMTQLVAHFKTVDGTMYPATVSEIKNKVSPGGAALLMLSSKVPKTFPITGTHIMIGEAVTEDKLTEIGKKPDAYVNATAFWLPQESHTVQDRLKDIDLAPYTLSLGNIHTKIDGAGLTLKFDYELAKDMLLVTNMENRKLIVELEDDGGKVKLTKEFAFEPSTGVGSQASEVAGDKLLLGKHKDLEMKLGDSEIIYLVRFLSGYKLHIYESFDGQKKLLASKHIQWFETVE